MHFFVYLYKQTINVLKYTINAFLKVNKIYNNIFLIKILSIFKAILFVIIMPTIVLFLLKNIDKNSILNSFSFLFQITMI